MTGREWRHPTMGSGHGFSRAYEPAPGRHVFFAGQAPTDDTGATVAGGIAEQADACFGKLRALVEAAGGTMADFAMLNIYVTEASFLRDVGAVRARYFTEPPYPASSGFAVKALVQPDWLVEIDGVAVIGGSA
jgi:2-iminobutanoate/2-iminopropanoate deaminase